MKNKTSENQKIKNKKEQNEIIKNELITVKKNVKDLKVDEPEIPNKVKEKAYIAASNSLKKSKVLGSGVVVVPNNNKEDLNNISKIFGTNAKATENILIMNLRKNDKYEYLEDNESKSGIGITAIQKIASDRAIYLVDISQSDINDFSRKFIGMVLSNPEVELQRLKAKDNLNILDNNQKEIKRENAIVDEVTGEEFDGDLEIHHKTAQSVTPDYREKTSDDNYSAMKKNTHSKGHSSGILDDSNLTWEEQKEKLNEYIMKKKSNKC
ncbi:MAG: hypothetical protein ACRC0F_01250 [Cetobacterium sp.]